MEKVEKVVNPPQIPTVMKSAHELLSLEFLLKNPHSSPITRQPTMIVFFRISGINSVRTLR